MNPQQNTKSLNNNSSKNAKTEKLGMSGYINSAKTIESQALKGSSNNDCFKMNSGRSDNLFFTEKDLITNQEKNINKAGFENNNTNNNNNNTNNNKDEDNIKVTLRIRPRNNNESENCNLIEFLHSTTIKLKTKPDEKFSFDFVATEEINQEQMFAHCGKEVADNVLQGYNGTILAYGQTSSGKTYTLIGSRENIYDKINKAGLNSNNTQNNNNHPVINSAAQAQSIIEIKKFLNSEKRGIIPRAIDYILQNTDEKKKNDENTKINLKCSFFEIYNNDLRDLIEDNKDPKKTMEIMEIPFQTDPVEGKETKNNIKMKGRPISKNVCSNKTFNKGIETKNNPCAAEEKFIYITNLSKHQFENYNEAISYLSKGIIQ